MNGFVQRMVSRLSDPFGDCKDPTEVDKTFNAYAEHFPVTFTPAVSCFVLWTLCRAVVSFLFHYSVVVTGVHLRERKNRLLSTCQNVTIDSHPRNSYCVLQCKLLRFHVKHKNQNKYKNDWLTASWVFLSSYHEMSKPMAILFCYIRNQVAFGCFFLTILFVILFLCDLSVSPAH